MRMISLFLNNAPLKLKRFHLLHFLSKRVTLRSMLGGGTATLLRWCLGGGMRTCVTHGIVRSAGIYSFFLTF